MLFNCIILNTLKTTSQYSLDNNRGNNHSRPQIKLFSHLHFFLTSFCSLLLLSSKCSLKNFLICKKWCHSVLNKNDITNERWYTCSYPKFLWLYKILQLSIMVEYTDAQRHHYTISSKIDLSLGACISSYE